MIRRRLAIVLLCSAACAAAAQELDIEPEVRAALTSLLRLSAADLAAARRGEVVQHGLPSRAPGEIAVAGAVRIAAPKEAFFARVRDIVRFKSGPDVLQIGRFSATPSLQDLAALTIDRTTFDPQSCHVGDCNVRLSADAIKRFEHDVDANAADAEARAAAWFKQLLLDTVEAYVSGSGRMATVTDFCTSLARSSTGSRAMRYPSAVTVQM